MPDTTTSANLTLDGARKVLDAALAKATDMGLAFCIVVADASGEPIVSAGMDGGPRLSAGIAADKAYSVTGFGGLPTGAWWDMIKDEPALVNGLPQTPRLTIFGGGVGVFVDDGLVDRQVVLDRGGLRWCPAKAPGVLDASCVLSEVGVSGVEPDESLSGAACGVVEDLGGFLGLEADEESEAVAAFPESASAFLCGVGVTEFPA